MWMVSHHEASFPVTSRPPFGANIAPPIMRNDIGMMMTPAGASVGYLSTSSPSVITAASTRPEMTS
jgi:hypothetical protein